MSLVRTSGDIFERAMRDSLKEGMRASIFEGQGVGNQELRRWGHRSGYEILLISNTIACLALVLKSWIMFDRSFRGSLTRKMPILTSNKAQGAGNQELRSWRHLSKDEILLIFNNIACLASWLKLWNIFD